MIVEIFVAEHWSMKALTNKLLNGVFDIAQVKMANETRGQNLIPDHCGAQVRAGVVIRDLPANVVAVGNPSRVIRPMK